METGTGMIFDIRRFAIHDGPGIRTTVFFKGCPLDCVWCHNPEARSSVVEDFALRPTENDKSPSIKRARIGSVLSVAEVMEEVAKDEIFYDQSGGGVTFSGGEPMFQLDFLEELLASCKRIGFHTAVDTCGYSPADDFERIYGLVDLFLYDLKLIDNNSHLRYTGVPNALILTNLMMLAEKGNRVMIRIPMIPDITDTRQNIDGILSFLKPLKSITDISLLPYNKLGEDKIERYQMSRQALKLESQAAEALDEKASWIRSCGYNVKIGG